MAKYERAFRGDFSSFLGALNVAVLQGSMSATLEETSDITLGAVRCAVRVYERYSYLGGNRVSLSVTLLGNGKDLYLSAITSGGSQAVFFKINTFGEQAFLDKLRSFTEDYIGRSGA